MTDLIQQHQGDVHKIAIEIDRLITNSPQAKSRFTKYINRFCKMVENYGEALQSYEKLFGETFNKLQKQQNKKSCKRLPLPAGWREVGVADTVFVKSCVNSTGLLFGLAGVTEIVCCAQPQNAVNPAAWFQLVPQLTQTQREPTDNEKLMCDYVLLATIHDRILQAKIDKKFFSDKYKGQWFNREGFRKTLCEFYYYDVHPVFRRDPQSITSGERQDLQKKLSELTCARNGVKADLANLPAETPLASDKAKTITPADAKEDMKKVKEIAEAFNRTSSCISQLCKAGSIKSEGFGQKRKVSLKSAASYFAKVTKKHKEADNKKDLYVNQIVKS